MPHATVFLEYPSLLPLFHSSPASIRTPVDYQVASGVGKRRLSRRDASVAAVHQDADGQCYSESVTTRAICHRKCPPRSPVVSPTKSRIIPWSIDHDTRLGLRRKKCSCRSLFFKRDRRGLFRALARRADFWGLFCGSSIVVFVFVYFITEHQFCI